MTMPGSEYPPVCPKFDHGFCALDKRRCLWGFDLDGEPEWTCCEGYKSAMRELAENLRKEV